MIPNATVRRTAAATQLTYHARVAPTPLTVSLTNLPVEMTIELVITNQTGADVELAQVEVTILVGSGASLTPTTQGVGVNVSDPVTWSFTAPPPTSDGAATFTLAPQAGNFGTLANGASVVVQIFKLATNPTPGTSTVAIKETVYTKGPEFTQFDITTYPYGFYFNGLAASVYSGSVLVPVAQVPAGATVVLTWNTSVIEASDVTVYFSDAAGQQAQTPTNLGTWTSPPLTADTVFTVVVSATTGVGDPITASQSIAVGVQDPAVVAASLAAATLALSGNATIGGSATITGAVNGVTLAGGAVTAPGTITGGAFSTTGAVSAASIAATGAVTANEVGAPSATFSTSLNAGAASVDSLAVSGSISGGGATLSSLGVTGAVTMFQIRNYAPGGAMTLTVPTDGFALGISSPTGDSSKPCAGWVTIQSPLGTQSAFGGYLSGPDKYNWAVPGYLCVPVQKGWQVTWNYIEPPQDDVANSVAFFFFASLGTSTQLPASTSTMAVPAPSFASGISYADRGRAVMERAAAVAAAIDAALPVPMDDAKRAAFIAAVVELVRVAG